MLDNFSFLGCNRKIHVLRAAISCKLFAHFNLLSIVLKEQKMVEAWVHPYPCAAEAFCVCFVQI